jgi:hypothetical protein
MAVEDEQDRSDDEQHSFVERARDRQEAYRGQPADRSWNSLVADDETHGTGSSLHERCEGIHLRKVRA